MATTFHVWGRSVSGLTGWWARQDSNLQPDRYERVSVPVRASKTNDLRDRSCPLCRALFPSFHSRFIPVAGPVAGLFATRIRRFVKGRWLRNTSTAAWNLHKQRSTEVWRGKASRSSPVRKGFGVCPVSECALEAALDSPSYAEIIFDHRCHKPPRRSIRAQNAGAAFFVWPLRNKGAALINSLQQHEKAPSRCCGSTTSRSSAVCITVRLSSTLGTALSEARSISPSKAEIADVRPLAPSLRRTMVSDPPSKRSLFAAFTAIGAWP